MIAVKYSPMKANQSMGPFSTDSKGSMLVLGDPQPGVHPPAPEAPNAFVTTF